MTPSATSLRILMYLCVAAIIMNVTNYMFYRSYANKIKPYHGNDNRASLKPQTARTMLLKKLIGEDKSRAASEAALTTNPAFSSEYDTTTDRQTSCTAVPWRRFSFFDIHNKVDNGKIAEGLEGTNITATTSGNSHVVLCDDSGWAHLISRAWEVTPFKCYELNVTLAQQLPHDPLLVTVGEDEAGTPLIKVWDWSRKDRHGSPTCVRVARAVPSHLRPTRATAVALHDNKNLLAVGFADGSVTLYRGDIARQRAAKMKTLSDSGSSPITTLAFSGTDKLFVVSRSSVLVYWLTSERGVTLDHQQGAAPGCAVLADKHGLMVAADDAIYCYTTEGRGSCYAIEGEKVRLNWFRSYLVIITLETAKHATTSSAPTPKSHHITILDIQNKFIVFSKTFEEIDAVISEWGSFYILTKSKQMIYLDEKDLHSKLWLLFKKNLYDVAIRIASKQQYDAEGLIEIYKQYGDHLYAKGDLKGAIEQYVKTIGYLETSYVIRKYLEPRHLEPLVLYLEELHKKGRATEDHTTLLLTCYVKLDQHDQQGKLKGFINSKDKVIEFDVDVAIKVVHQVSIEDALSLAMNYKRHDWCLKLMVEEQKAFSAALAYLSDLEFEDADTYMKKYGLKLIQNLPDESTKFLIALCTDYKPRSAPLVDESTLSGSHREPDRANPDDYIHMFLSHSEHLIDFLQQLTARQECSELVYNALIEHYIHVWAKSPPEKKVEYEEKTMKVLRDPNANYDKHQTLVICQTLGFRPGILHLYEENKLWRAQVALHMRAGEVEAAIEVCRWRGTQAPRLWLDVLWTRSRVPPAPLSELLRVLDSKKLLSPILVIDCLASTSSYTLGDVRRYLTDVLKAEDEVISREHELAVKYKSESERMKAHIHTLQNEPVTFQSSKCAACSRPLELPSVHFLCQHSFHQHCFQSYAESERECPACVKSARREPPPPAADSLHARLNSQPDPYAVVSEFYGRGLFNKLTVITEPEPKPAAPAPSAPAAQGYGAGAEAKLRLQEGQSKQMFVSHATKQVAPKGTAVIPVPEGRMRLLEQQQYSSSLEANMSRPEPKVHKSPLPTRSPKPPSPKISAAISNGAKNPFEDETYDDAKNPFADDEVDDPTNPFAEDDYDKNLNPFS